MTTAIVRHTDGAGDLCDRSGDYSGVGTEGLALPADSNAKWSRCPKSTPLVCTHPSLHARLHFWRAPAAPLGGGARGETLEMRLGRVPVFLVEVDANSAFAGFCSRKLTTMCGTSIRSMTGEPSGASPRTVWGSPSPIASGLSPAASSWLPWPPGQRSVLPAPMFRSTFFVGGAVLWVRVSCRRRHCSGPRPVVHYNHTVN